MAVTYELPVNKKRVLYNHARIETLLGSCLFIAFLHKNPEKRKPNEPLAVVAHVSSPHLPQNRRSKSSSERYVDVAIDRIAKLFPNGAEIRVAGGANMLGSDIAQKNIESLENKLKELLKNKRFELKGKHVGGNSPRFVEFDTKERRMRVFTSRDRKRKLAEF